MTPCKTKEGARRAMRERLVELGEKDKCIDETEDGNGLYAKVRGGILIGRWMRYDDDRVPTLVDLVHRKVMDTVDDFSTRAHATELLQQGDVGGYLEEVRFVRGDEREHPVQGRLPPYSGLRYETCGFLKTGTMFCCLSGDEHRTLKELKRLQSARRLESLTALRNDKDSTELADRIATGMVTNMKATFRADGGEIKVRLDDGDRPEMHLHCTVPREVVKEAAAQLEEQEIASSEREAKRTGKEESP